jgi:hypothetical protein
MYSRTDLEILEIGPNLRSHVDRWFPGGVMGPLELCLEIARCAMSMGTESVTIERRGETWSVGGDTDWLRDIQPNYRAIFERTFPIPGYPNSMRPETWLAAYASDVIVSGPEGHTPVIGEGVMGEGELASFEGKWARRITFRLDSELMAG